MIKHGIIGDFEDVILQILERLDANNLLMCLGIAEDKVAEAHVFLHNQAQIKAHLL